MRDEKADAVATVAMDVAGRAAYLVMAMKGRVSRLEMHVSVEHGALALGSSLILEPDIDLVLEDARDDADVLLGLAGIVARRRISGAIPVPEHWERIAACLAERYGDPNERHERLDAMTKRVEVFFSDDRSMEAAKALVAAVFDCMGRGVAQAGGLKEGQRGVVKLTGGEVVEIIRVATSGS